MVRRVLGAALMAVLLGCASTPPVFEPPLPLPWHEGAKEGRSASASVDSERQETWRYLGFEVRDAGAIGLFLWDARQGEVRALNEALTGLSALPAYGLRPRVFADGKKILFTVGAKSFFWDFKTEERTTPVTDGRLALAGGPQSVVTPDGKWIAYLSHRETVVLKRADGPLIAKAVELSSPLGEPVWDLDMTADAARMVLNIAGRAYFYDVRNARLSLYGPLDGESLAGARNGLEEVAVSPTGKVVAATLKNGRVLLVEPQGRLVELLPAVNLAVERIVDLYFVSDDEAMLVTEQEGRMGIWAFERRTGWLRRMVMANGIPY